ncbi:unnamed protein product [Protopolystoma xenopodis]|uniref:Uncharacterized protein n=1 Tax=Protopolystoma xenopodis TaxID=117903 RepID=A0A3S5C5I4_9PLAT|nr:unnamed protein product [Protopolystoma xenopodis]
MIISNVEAWACHIPKRIAGIISEYRAIEQLDKKENSLSTMPAKLLEMYHLQDSTLEIIMQTMDTGLDAFH